MDLAPICVFAYNRPQHLFRTLAALQGNTLAAKSDLTIYADGPKTSSEAGQVEEVRRVARSISGFRSTALIESSTNLGLSRSIVRGVTSTCDNFGRAIVVEDDLVVSPYFLDYMNAGLETYEGDKQVASIHAYLYPLAERLPDTFFLRGADCWGWATWKRAWDWYEPDGTQLLSGMRQAGLLTRFDINGACDYSGMLRDQIEKRNDSWAIRWYASVLLRNGLTLYPGRSLVHNIGNDNSGTHTKRTSLYDTQLAERPIRVERIPFKENEVALAAIERFLRSIKPTLARRISAKIERLRRKIS